MLENPRRGRQARNFITNVPKILDLESSSEQIFSEDWRWVPLFFVQFLGCPSLNIETQWFRYLPEVKNAIRSVGSRTYKCKYIDVTSIFCISGVEIHFWQHFNVRLWRHSILKGKEWYFEKCGFWEILGRHRKRFDGSRSLVFFLIFTSRSVKCFCRRRSRCLGFVILSFHLVLRSQFFRVHGYSLWNRTCRL